MNEVMEYICIYVMEYIYIHTQHFYASFLNKYIFYFKENFLMQQYFKSVTYITYNKCLELVDSLSLSPLFSPFTLILRSSPASHPHIKWSGSNVSTNLISPWSRTEVSVVLDHGDTAQFWGVKKKQMQQLSIIGDVWEFTEKNPQRSSPFLAMGL